MCSSFPNRNELKHSFYFIALPLVDKMARACTHGGKKLGPHYALGKGIFCLTLLNQHFSLFVACLHLDFVDIQLFLLSDQSNSCSDQRQDIGNCRLDANGCPGRFPLRHDNHGSAIFCRRTPRCHTLPTSTPNGVPSLYACHGGFICAWFLC